MYIVLTNIDSITLELCTIAPMANGPAIPYIESFIYEFSNESVYPIITTEAGIYTKLPLYYGTCADNADINLTGVIRTLTAEEFNLAKETEHLDRRPYPSWVGDITTMSWHPPVDYPILPQYRWDEATTLWVQI